MLVITVVLPITQTKVYAAGSSYTDAVAVELNEVVSFADPTPEDNDDKTNYYMFETGAKGIYSINFVSTGKGGIVEFLVADSKYNKLYSSDWLSYNSAEGANIELSLEKNSVYYIRAKAKGAVGTVNASAYDLTVTERVNLNKAGKPIISSLKAGSKSFTVKYGAVSIGASKYQIAYRVKGASKWKTTDVSGDTFSKTIKNLKSKKTYQVRVRALKIVNGKTYHGSWSSVKTVKIK